MNRILLIIFHIFAGFLIHADTPPPGTVKAKVWSGDGNTSIGVVSDALKVNLTNSSLATTGTFWQATQPVSGPLTDAQLRASPVSISGSITATNASIGTTGSAPPASATLFGGSDGTNLRAVKVSAAGVVSIDGSGVTQPINGTVTANAGTNLNTSLLALESGGNLASINTKTPALGQALAAASVPVVLTAAQITTLTPLSSVSVSNFPATQPVSGTVTANAGTGTFTVDASGHTVPISAASLPLPSGAATAAKQPALGTAGTASSDIVTVQGIASMTPLKVDGSSVTQPVSGNVSVSNFPATQPISAAALPLPSGAATAAGLTTINTTLGTPMQSSGGSVTANIGATNGLALDSSVNGLLVGQNSTTSGQSGPLVQGAVTTAAPSYTTAKTSPLSLNTSGGLRVDGSGVTQPISAASLPLPTGASTAAGLTTINSTLGSPFQAGGSIANTAFASTQSGVWTVQPGNTANTTAWKVDGSAVTQPISIATAPVLVAGSAIIGKVGIDQTTPGTTNGVQINAAIPAGANVIGHVIADSGSTTAVTGNVATTVADGANVTIGGKADAKNAATDATAISIMSVLKQISASVQAPPSQAVTNAGTFATQSTLAAETTKVIGTVNVAASQTIGISAGSAVIGHVINDSGSTTAVTGNVAVTVADAANVTLGAKADAKSTATDTTAITVMQVLKEISAMEQAPASRAVTNAGTFATQSTLSAETTKVIGTVNIASAQTVGIAAGSAVIGHVIVDTAPTTAVTQSGNFNIQYNAINSSASETTGNVSTVITLTAPSNAIGFILQAKDANTANMRWAMGATATTTAGQQLQPGRDTGYVPAGANVSIVAESGTQEYEIQWVSTH